MRAWLLLFSLLPGLALAEACVVHSQAERLDVKVCQENRNIPATLFREGFCQPQLQGQTVEVEFVDRLRGMVKFEGIEALVETMHDDVRRAREILA